MYKISPNNTRSDSSIKCLNIATSFRAIAIIFLTFTTLPDSKVFAQDSDADGNQEFMGINWGIGIGAAFGNGPDRISEAEMVNNLVRVKDDVTNTPRLVLEVHDFMYKLRPISEWRESGQGNVTDANVSPDYRWGVGPFVAVNFGSTGSEASTLTSFGGGIIFGRRMRNSDRSFNIGLGYMLDANVKQFGDGIHKNMALPEGETEIRFKEESESSFIIFFSTTF